MCIPACTLAAPFWPPENTLPLVWSVAKLQWSNPLLSFDLDIKDGEKIFDLKGQGLWIKSPCKMTVKQRNRYADKLYLFADTAYSVLLQHVSPNISWMHQGYEGKSLSPESPLIWEQKFNICKLKIRVLKKGPSIGPALIKSHTLAHIIELKTHDGFSNCI